MTIEELHKLWDKKNKGKAAPSEHDLQVTCLRWLRYAHPGIFYYAIPNGGYRTITTAKAMRAEGQRPGVPDLHFPIGRGEYLSLYIEMKNGKAGQLSDAQKEMHIKLQDYGNKVVVCRNTKEFINTINEYLYENENV